MLKIVFERVESVSVLFKCFHVFHGMWNALSDSVALHAVLREEAQLAAGEPEVDI